MEFGQFVANNRSCTVDADCTRASSTCAGLGYCCTLYVNTLHDSGLHRTLIARMLANGGGCGCCDRVARPGVYRRRTCGTRAPAVLSARRDSPAATRAVAPLPVNAAVVS